MNDLVKKLTEIRNNICDVSVDFYGENPPNEYGEYDDEEDAFSLLLCNALQYINDALGMIEEMDKTGKK